MKLPINWLKEFVDIPQSVGDLTDKLTAIGHMQDHQPEHIGNDVVLDLEVRQNRSDCLSIIGLAREVAASLKTPLNLPALSVVLPKQSIPSKISIEDADACYRFNSLSIDHIKIAASPAWLVKKLEAYGVKPINNLVDITNFVMIEYGQPLHAFDREKIDKSIIVRFAKKNEKLQILGGKEISLTTSDLVISDDKQALALGGLIGGVKSSISDDTSSIILEAATYNQAYIRRSSLRHRIRTEASLRHEKFLHPDLTEVALKRAGELIIELCSGIIKEHDDAYVNVAKPVVLNLSLDRLHMLCGVQIGMEESLRILNSLGINAKKIDDNNISTQIPYFRTDLVVEEDIIEEVLRIFGYEKIPDTLPHSSPPEEITSKSFRLEEELRDILVGYGFDEVITEPLVNESSSILEPVRLQNSLNADKTMLRTTLENGLTAALQYQSKAKKKGISIFEIGKIYSVEQGSYKEEKVIGGIIATFQANYSSTKGILEAICARIQREFNLDYISLRELEHNVWYFEMNIEKILKQETVSSFIIQTNLPQIIYQDLSFSVPKDTHVGPILLVIRNLSPIIYKVSLGEQPFITKEGRKNVFVKLQYHQPDAQLTTKDIEPIKTKILSVIKTKFNGIPR